MSTETEIIEWLKENFIVPDNIPEDLQRRHEICMEARASLLIEANCTSEYFPAFMKCGCREGTGWIYPFSPPFVSRLPHNFSDGTFDINWTFSEFEIGNERFSVGFVNCNEDRWHLKVRHDSSSSAKINLAAHTEGANGCCNETLVDDFKKIEQIFQQTYRSRFQLCSGISPYKTPEQVCRFFRNQADAFAGLKTGNMRLDRFPQGSFSPNIRQEDQADWTEERLIQWNLQQLLPCTLAGAEQLHLCNKYYDDWFCQVFPFRNEYGEIRMQLIKLYDSAAQTKSLIPVTSWMRGNYPHNQFFCVPLPEDKQPLYNLDLLLKPETETVVLTDSVEVADSNQRNAPTGTVFTSFICSPGRYEQVDWSPLREKNVYYLITNHSGICFEPATLKARELEEYLNEEEPELELAFITLPVDYHTGKRTSLPVCRDFATVDDILEHRHELPPVIKAEGIRILESEEEFQEFCRKAEDAIHAHPREWWEKEGSSNEQSRLIDEESKVLKPIDYVMRPILIRGEATMLYAREKRGKSALAYSIAARVVAGDFSTRPVPLLPEKWWTVPQKGHKVLYLDFENKQLIGRNKSLFQEPYFPVEKKAECQQNLIIKDLSDEGKDYSLEDNQKEIIGMINDARQEGMPDLPVDLLVIDTYTAFTLTEEPQTPANFKQFINKIRSMGIAVLIVHHANAEDEVRGFRSKLDQLAFKFKAYRDSNENGDLEESPVWIEYEETRLVMGHKLKEPFQVQYSNSDHHWHVVNPLRDENAELKLIVDDYKRYGYNRDAICAMLGLQKSALSERLAEVKKQ